MKKNYIIMDKYYNNKNSYYNYLFKDRVLDYINVTFKIENTSKDMFLKAFSLTEEHSKSRMSIISPMGYFDYDPTIKEEIYLNSIISSKNDIFIYIL